MEVDVRGSFWVYILRCADNSYYAGHTDDLEARIAAHHSGEIAGYTQNRRPLELVYSGDFASRADALAAERQIKGWSRKKKEALIRGDWHELRRLARGRSRAPAEEEGDASVRANGSHPFVLSPSKDERMNPRT